MNENWATLWEGVADALPEQVALVQGDRRTTWAELDDRAARLASALTEWGATLDTKVAFLAYNCPEYLEGAYATFKVRGAPINLNFRYRDDELVAVLDDADAQMLFFHGSFADTVDRIRRRLPKLRTVIQFDDGSPTLDGAFGYEDVLRTHEPMSRIPRSGDDVFLLYTGGTTGRPRGVMWHHRDIISTLSFSAYTLAGVPAPTDADGAARCAVEMHAKGMAPVFVPASPLIHGTAFYLAQAAWLLGGTVVMLQSHALDADELWQVVEKERVTQIAIVGDAFARPMVHALQTAERDRRPYDISSVQRIASSGVAWSSQWKQELIDRGQMALIDMVGASEGGPFSVQVVPPGGRAEDCKFLRGERARLLREDGSRIEPGTGEMGLLAVTPPVPIGYYKDPAKSAQLLHEYDGELFCIPGDHAYVESDGTVILLGRGALSINTGGEKAYPEEIEQAVLQHPDVLDANVVGVPDDYWGEAITAVVELRPGAAQNASAIQQVVRDRLAGYKVPKHVVFVEHVHRSPAGKAQYAWAREVARASVGQSDGFPAAGRHP
jgi:3-oxocholest-4-en-26-oate---CoA ligase